MRSISVNDYLNADNKWTRRLLGVESFQMIRNAEKVVQEYGKEKWGSLLQRKPQDMEQAKSFEFELTVGSNWRESKTVVSFGDDLFHIDQVLFREMYFNTLRNKLGKYKSLAYCELGCGYGYNLSLLPGVTYGGEFTEAGVTIGKNLGVDVCHFDFYKQESYKMLRPGSVVFTVQALEQIPDATSFLKGMRTHREKVEYVVHFEGSVLTERRNLLGLLRNRYQEINDYNRNLIELLRNADDIEILESELDMVGAPPLNSLHFVVWRFKNK